MADAFTLNPGSIVAMGRGHNDYGLFFNWTAGEIYCVTRPKENAAYEAVEECVVPKDRNTLCDRLIRFTGVQAQKDCPCLLWRVSVWDAVNEREMAAPSVEGQMAAVQSGLDVAARTVYIS